MAAGDAFRDIDDHNSTEQTLQDHLLWQLNLTPMSETDRLIAAAIIDAVNTDGMLEAGVGELLESFDARLDIGADEVDAVLKRIQHFDPTGVAARNLAECLALQLEALDAATPWRDQAIAIVTEYLDLLGARDFTTLKRRTRLSEAELAKTVTLIQSLNPRPGAALASGRAEYVIPDVVVRKEKNRWLVELNPEATPAIRINTGYASLVKRADNSRQNTWLKDNLQEARWFLKSLESRHNHPAQGRLQDRRIPARVPGTRRGGHAAAGAARRRRGRRSARIDHFAGYQPQIHADAPGLYELKYFFSSHVGSTDGDAVSSIAIRALIKKLTADENPRKPLSDNKIAAILAQRNINVARRTVAKYRESMSIPPSNGRKRLV